MQTTWNKSLNANIIYCVQYLEKEAKVLTLTRKRCFATFAHAGGVGATPLAFENGAS